MSVRLSPGTTHGPRWFLPQSPEAHQGRPCHFFWQIQWNTSATSGFIIQEIYTEIHEQTCFAAAASPVIWTRYWEAWAVTALSTIENDGHDVWTIQLGNTTRGWWVKRSVAYWVSALDNPGSWSRTAVADTNGLLGKRSRPTNLGVPQPPRGPGRMVRLRAECRQQLPSRHSARPGGDDPSPRRRSARRPLILDVGAPIPPRHGIGRSR